MFNATKIREKKWKIKQGRRGTDILMSWRSCVRAAGIQFAWRYLKIKREKRVRWFARCTGQSIVITKIRHQ